MLAYFVVPSWYKRLFIKIILHNSIIFISVIQKFKHLQLSTYKLFPLLPLFFSNKYHLFPRNFFFIHRTAMRCTYMLICFKAVCLILKCFFFTHKSSFNIKITYFIMTCFNCSVFNFYLLIKLINCSVFNFYLLIKLINKSCLFFFLFLKFLW